MRKLLIPLLAMLAPLSAWGQGSLLRRQGRCELGGQQPVIQGLISTGTVPTGTIPPLSPVGAAMASYPGCQVDVYFTGTSNHAPIYSDNLLTPTPQANPFNASTVTGSFGFYWASPTSTSNCYDVVTSGAGMPSPYTDAYVCPGGVPASSGGGGGTSSGVAISPGTVNFGFVQVGTLTPPQLPLTIANTGTSTVTVNGVSLAPSSDFTLLAPNLCNGNLVGGAVCTLPVQANPTSVAHKTATATLSTSLPADPQAPLTVNLSADGTGTSTALVTLIGFGSGSGTVTDGASVAAIFTQGQCLGVCQFSYPIGTVVTYSPLANADSVFSGFVGGGLSLSNFTFTVTQSQTITVSFNLAVPDIVLTLAAIGQGGGNIQSNVPSTNGQGGLNCTAAAGVVIPGGAAGCNGPFTSGTPITLTATPNAISQFVSWSGAPPSCTTNVCVLTPSSSLTVTANFSSSAVMSQLGLTQVTSNCTVMSTTIACVWGQAQLAGDMNICAGTWPDNTTTVAGMADTGANTYVQVPTVSPKTTAGLTQVVYYAQNITGAAAGVRTTTMTLSSSAASSEAATSLFGNHDLATANSYSSTSITLPNNQLILVATWAQLNSGNGPGPVTSITDTAGGLTWTLVLANDFNSTQGTGTTTREEVWRAVGTGATGIVTVHWGVSTAGHAMDISAWSGVDISGGGANAIGISAKNTGVGTAASVTMGTFGAASNGTYAAFGSGASKARTAGAGMTVLGADQLQSGEWAAGNIATPAQTLASSAAWGGIAIEIKATGAAGRRDMRCLEYSGVKQSGSPIDVSVAAVGSSAVPASGSVTPTAGDLTTGFTASLSSVNTVSLGFTQRVKNTFGDDEEDVEGATGSASNYQPTLTSSANWIATQIGWLPQTGALPVNFSLTLLPSAGTGGGTVFANVGTPNLGGIVSPTGCVSAGNNAGCSSSVPANVPITLVATANQGAVFLGWVGITGCTTSATCLLPPITSNQNIQANFSLSGQVALFVNGTTGSDNNDGLAAVAGGGHGPWRSFLHAASAAQIGPSGTVITFTPFNYGETVTLPKGGSSPTARLAFRCSTPWTVGGLNCKMTQINTYLVNNVDIGATGQLGFEITNPGGQVGINDVANFCNTGTGACNVGNSIHMLANYLHDISVGVCNASGAILSGQHGRQQTDIQAIGNQVDNIGNFPSSSCSEMQGIYIVNPGAIIQNNIITRVAAGGIQYYDEACLGVVSNNTVLNNHFGIIIYGGNGCTPGLNTVSNNIIANNSGAGIYNGFSSAGDCVPGRSTLFTNNILFGNGTDFQQPQPACEIRLNTVSENPTATFVSYTGDATGNYQLKPTSGAVNTGVFTCVAGGQPTCAPGKDFFGVPRPQRQTIDRGAIELP